MIAQTKRNTGVRKVAEQWLKDVLTALYQRPTATREQILQATSLNPASATHALQSLMRSGTILKLGALESRVGRRREVLKLNEEAGYFLAVDLETTRIRFALTSLIGDVRSRAEQELQVGRELDVRSLQQGLDVVRRNLAPWQHSRILAVGISYPGVMEAPGLVTSVNLGWRKFPLAKKLQQVTALPTFLESSCQTYALAEHWFGEGQGSDNCIFVELGKGIGAGIFAGGRYIEGRAQMAGEFGHITIDPTAEDRCNCGKRGCLEAIASGPNIIRQYLELSGGSPASANGDQLNAIFEKARNKDPIALKVLDRVGKVLGLGLSHLMVLLDPDLIVLGGDLIQGEDLLLPRIQREVATRVPVFTKPAELRLTSLGHDIGLKGAASLAFRGCIHNSALLQQLCRPLSEPVDARSVPAGLRLARRLRGA